MFLLISEADRIEIGSENFDMHVNEIMAYLRIAGSGALPILASWGFAHPWKFSAGPKEKHLWGSCLVLCCTALGQRLCAQGVFPTLPAPPGQGLGSVCISVLRLELIAGSASPRATLFSTVYGFCFISSLYHPIYR